MQDILSDQYKREIAYQKLRYETDKQSRIRSEYENNLRIRKELEEERVKNYIKKKNIAEKQYNDYMKGL